MLGRLLRTMAVWYLYFPHRSMLRLVGPKNGVRFSRVAAFVHWLITWVGGESRAKRAIQAARPSFAAAARTNSILRRHLQTKHQHFVEWYTFPSPAGARYVRESYPRLEGREHLDVALALGRGVVVVMYHFCVGKMIFPALDALGYETYHHVFRGATYEGAVYGGIARRAMETMAEAEKRSGLRVIYHRPGYTFPLMVRLLKKNAIVGMNADGMTGTDFVDVRFLNGTMSFPTGPARLAAVSGAPIVPIFGLHTDVAEHRLIAHPRIDVAADTPAEVAHAVQACTQLLESYVVEHPWAWWTWRRMAVTRMADGSVRYAAKVNRQDENAFHHESLARAGSACTAAG